MPERIRCPNCQAAIRADAGAVPSRCPTCGALLARGAKRKPDGEPKERPDAEAPVAAGAAQEERRPARRKRRRRRQPAEGIDLVGPLQALGAAALLLGASYGLSWVVRFAVNRPAVAMVPAAPAPGPQAAVPGPAPPTGHAAPRPKDAPLVLAAVGRSFLVKGDPLLSSGDATYIMDTPLEEGNYIPALAEKDPPTIRIYELANGKYWGYLAKAAPRVKESLLGPDGRSLATLGVAPGPGTLPPIEVWRVTETRPSARPPVQGSAFWMDFLSPAELAVAARDASGAHVQVFSLPAGTPLRLFRLPEPQFPPAEGQAPLPHRLDHLVGAVAQRAPLLALGGSSAILVLSAKDGRAVATLPVATDGERVEYRGMRFTPSGDELSAVFALRKGNGPTAVHLKTWPLPDGRVKQDVLLTDLNASGPPLPGPGPDRVFVLTPRAVGTKRPLLGVIVGAHTGAKVAEVPYRPLRSLDDGRLLVLGPTKDAPPPVPLGGSPAVSVNPAPAREKPGDEPNERAVYAMTVSGGPGR